MKEQVLQNVNVLYQDKIVENGMVLIHGDKIGSVTGRRELLADGECQIIDGNGLTAVPGYIDTHCHGGANYDVNDGTEEAVIRMSEFYLMHGLTAYYPSTYSDSPDKMEKAFDAVRQVMKKDKLGIEVLGAHMEGPFINHDYRGAQPAEMILELTDENFELVMRNSDVIKRITLASEIPMNFKRIRQFRDTGMVVSLGHTAAVYSEIEAAVREGATMSTHLYSGMATIKRQGPYRVSGLLETALDMDALYTEIIADRKHLPDELMRIAYKCKGADKLMLCSDANRGAGGADGGVVSICGLMAIIEDGVAILPDRTAFASSIMPIDQMVRNVVNYVGIPLLDAIKMVTATPARMMEIFDRKGSLAPGKDADIVLLDQDLQVKWVMCRGRVCHTVI